MLGNRKALSTFSRGENLKDVTIGNQQRNVVQNKFNEDSNEMYNGRSTTIPEGSTLK